MTLRVGAGGRVVSRAELLAGLTKAIAVETVEGKRPRIIACAWCRSPVVVRGKSGSRPRWCYAPRSCRREDMAAKAREAARLNPRSYSKCAREVGLVGPAGFADWMLWVRACEHEGKVGR